MYKREDQNTFSEKVVAFALIGIILMFLGSLFYDLIGK